MMTPDEFAAELRRIDDANGGDDGDRHIEADKLLVRVLREHGYGAGCDVYEEFHRWFE